MTARFYAFALPLVSITPSVLLLASPFHHFAPDSTTDTKLLRNVTLLCISLAHGSFLFLN
jgi:hypothetical protein